MSRRASFVLALLAIAAVIAASLSLRQRSAAVQAQPAGGGSTMPTSEVDALRELMERLLGESSGGSVSGGSVSVALSPIVTPVGGGMPPPPPAPRTRILLGELPADLPFQVPLPPDGRLLGSTVSDLAERFPGGPGLAPWRIFTLRAVLDVPETVDIYAFYDRAFEDLGWTRPVGGSRPVNFGGFQDEERARLMARASTAEPPRGLYCFASTDTLPDGASASVQIYQGRGGMLDVRVVAQGGVGGLCGFPAPALSTGEQLPTLTLPANVSIAQPYVIPSPLAGRSGSVITVTTTMLIDELVAHFATQLTSAGWSRRDGDASDLLAWSEWTSPDGSAAGFLSVLAVPGEDLRILSFLTRGA